MKLVQLESRICFMVKVSKLEDIIPDVTKQPEVLATAVNAGKLLGERLRQGMTCGAKTRAGTPCKLTSIYDNGRCKFHGGLSTGLKTTEGKRQSAKNGFKGKSKQSP